MMFFVACKNPEKFVNHGSTVTKVMANLPPF